MTTPINHTSPPTPTRPASLAVRVSGQEIEQGYILCPCGKYAHVTDHRVLRGLPREYSGEMCAECHCLMMPVGRLPNAESREAES
jgi:hypothetical protein